MPKTVVLEDDGYFILAAYFNGIPHPPGYPVYTFLSHLATYVPIGSIASRVHGLSAFLGALSCICLWWISTCLIPERIYAYAAALIYAFSKTFWSQSIIAEVYTLNVLLFFILVIISLNYSNQNANEESRLPYLFGFILGLGLSNHWPLIILSSPLILCILWPIRQKIIKNIRAIAFFTMAGLLPYLWMFYRSQMNPEISFYGPLVNFSDLWFYISREGYAEVEKSISAGWIDKVKFVGFIFKEMVSQFGLAGFLFSVIGFIYQWRLLPVRIGLGLTLCGLGNTVALILLLGFDYDLHHQNIFSVYPLIAYGILTLWLVMGVLLLADTLENNAFFKVRKKISCVGFMILITSTTLILSVHENYRANDTWAEGYARVILNTLKPNSVLFTYGDLTTGPIGYINKVEGVRSDVTLLSSKGQVFANRLFRPFKTTERESQEKINEFILNSDRPIYYLYGLTHNYGIEDSGIHRRILKNMPADYVKSVTNSEINTFFESLSGQGEPDDPWGAMHYRLILARYCKYQLLHDLSESISKMKNKHGAIVKHCNNYHSKMEFVEILLNQEHQDLFMISSILSEAELLQYQAINKADIARQYYYKGGIKFRQNQRVAAMDYYNKSFAAWPHPNNRATKKIELILKEN